MFVSTPFFSLMRQEWNMCSTARSVTDSLYQCDGLCVPMWRDFFCFLVASTIFYQCDGNFFTIVMKEKYHYDGIIFPVPKCLFTNVQGCQCTNVPRPLLSLLLPIWLWKLRPSNPFPPTRYTGFEGRKKHSSIPRFLSCKVEWHLPPPPTYIWRQSFFCEQSSSAPHVTQRNE